MKHTKIAFIDPGTFVPVHDRFFLNSVAEYVDVDFYYSVTKYNLRRTRSFRFKNRTVSIPYIKLDNN